MPRSATNAAVWRAISSSSLVGITSTVTSDEGAEITGPPAVFEAESNLTPSRSSPSSDRARTTGSFSPTPAVNAIASQPPSTAMYAPTYFRIR